MHSRKNSLQLQSLLLLELKDSNDLTPYLTTGRKHKAPQDTQEAKDKSKGKTTARFCLLGRCHWPWGTTLQAGDEGTTHASWNESLLRRKR